MASIKGITIKIGSDTVGLEKALTNVNKKSKSLQSELKDVEKLLKFNPNNVEALAQKQKLLTDAIENTANKLYQLREAEKQVQNQFAKGKISEEQYRAFRREIEFTEGSLDGLKNKLSTLKSEQDNLAKSTKQLETFLEATGTSAEELANVLGSKLSKAIIEGKASAKDLENALDKIGKSALGANVDLGKMKKALSSIDDGNSIKNVKKELNNLSKEANEAKQSVSELGGELTGLAAGLAAGGGIAGAVEKSLDFSTLDTKIDISFNVPEESKQAVKDAIKGIETYGIDAEAALEGVRRQWSLNADASDQANAKIIKGAGTIASAYSGIDFTELVQEINEISSELNITDENAMGLVNSLLKIGFPPEQLDIIAEYGKQLTDAGFNAQEVQAIMAAGVETGTWNIDNLLDGLKEGRIKLAEFGQEVPKATAELLANTEISKKQLQDWGTAVAEGGAKGQEAMEQVAQALLKVEDDTTRNALGVQIFGTMWEDQGTNITDTILGMSDHLATAKDNQQQLNDATASLDSSPAVLLKQAFSDLLTASAPLLEMIANVVSKVAEWASANPTLVATIVAILGVIGTLIGICMALAPIFITLAGVAAALGVSIGAIAAPVLIVIGVIAAIIAAGVALYKNWDTIMAKAGELGGKVKIKFNEIKQSISTAIKEAVSTVKEQLNKLAGFFSGLKLKLPKFKLPHFSISGSLSLKPPSVPKISVDWYKNGGVFAPNNKQIIGIGDANVPEAAIPLRDDVLGKIGEGIAKTMDGGGGSGIVINIQNAIVREDADIDKISRQIYKLINSEKRSKGVKRL